ncbi:Enoyl-CoA hydratase/carnithine racemase [Fontimonas thermophila]|uniref:Enoyl-CoA hydratase/carnithine racemase n=1 Tax=Fontimonas thermophila TaxID=1076937 RepID=A0A1I2HA19_9GAMM|nr:enoyl-CoA hydratase/isomerase family protein [Fontimonas thermophila]SFF27065.1 Enoyl-CoA hydratase/carnithine racemase [Fontimonas thermophila]
MSVTPYRLDCLRKWVALPAAAPDCSPLSPTPWLALDLASGAPDLDTAASVAWLQRVPVPTLAIGPCAAAPAIAGACDVHVATETEAEPLLDGIRRSPIAAAVFVRLLRSSAHLDLESALFAESLAYSTLQAGPEYGRWLAAHRAVAPARATDTGPAVVLDREGEVLRLELNRASNRNAMTVEMRDALCEALALAVADTGIAQVHIRGRGKCFSTGGDLTEFGSTPDPATAHIVRTLALPGRLLAACADRATVYVHGACIGSGIEFPAFAARLVARRDAWFQLPELRYGLIPGAGGCVSLPRRIGRQRTAWLVLTGQRINAQTALDWGLVDALSA